MDEGYAATQTLSQLHEAIIENCDLNDRQKSAITEKMAVRDMVVASDRHRARWKLGLGAITVTFKLPLLVYKRHLLLPSLFLNNLYLIIIIIVLFSTLHPLCGILFFCFIVCCLTHCFLSASGHGEVPCRWSRWVSAVVESLCSHYAADIPSQLKPIKTSFSQTSNFPDFIMNTTLLKNIQAAGHCLYLTQLFCFAFCKIILKIK